MRSSLARDLARHPGYSAAGSTIRAAVIAAAAGLALAGYAAAANPWTRGYALYHGYRALAGRIAGHEADLPVAASRCNNCHDTASGGSQTARPIAPLSRAALTISAARRGGPPSAYSETSFCAFLRNGVDAAFIQVSRTMPRFAASDAQCHDLWTYVISR